MSRKVLTIDCRDHGYKGNGHVIYQITSGKTYRNVA